MEVRTHDGSSRTHHTMLRTDLCVWKQVAFTCVLPTYTCNLRYNAHRTRTVLLEPVAQCSQKSMDRGPPRRVPATGPGRIAPVDGGGLGDTLHSERLAYVGTARVMHTSVCEPTGVHTSPLPAAPHRPNTC